jgi:hypothetical protein
MADSVKSSGTVKILQADGTYVTKSIPLGLWVIVNSTNVVRNNTAYDSNLKAQAALIGMVLK